MGYIKSRANGTVQGMYCDICGKKYVRVVSNPNDKSQDMCVKCYNDFFNGGQEKDQQIAELKAEIEQYKKNENTCCGTIAEMITNCDECELCECIGCEHSKSAVKEIKELKAENERLKKYEIVYYLNQLQASDEDIDKFKQNELQQCINISDLLKDNTKQVCEKIRDYITSNEKDEYDYYNDEFSGRYTVNVKDLNKFLNQIENGE